ncbi:hypothetical protein [Hymenobacter radiodurans]|uniref:hypothetical protein n=1 Tax=Hymenobacter radiodurans TaxID=2496028 RepID=UPI001058A493|nr:hypothetical protein [Hymenobacter radiodurans]
MRWLFLFFVLIGAGGCSRSDDALLDRLQTAIRTGPSLKEADYRVVDLAKLTDFPWDTLYFFRGSYDLSQRDVNRYLGFDWDSPPLDKTRNRILFVYQGQVAAYADCDSYERVNNNQKGSALSMVACPEDLAQVFVCTRANSKLAVFAHVREQDTSYACIPARCAYVIIEAFRKQK